MPDAPLGELLAVLIDHRGKTPKKLGGEFTQKGVPVASAVNIKSGRLRLDTPPRCVPEEMYRRWMPVPLKRGDVLLTSEAPLGAVAQVPDDAPLVLGQRLFALRGKPTILDSRYLYFLLQWQPVLDRLTARSTGTTVVGIRQAELVKVPVSIPSFAEQVAVGEVLGALDDKIEANRRTSKLAEELAVACVETAPQVVELEELAAIGRRMVAPASFVNDVVDHFSIPAHDRTRLPVRERGNAVKSGKFVIGSPTVLVSKLNPHIRRVWYALPEPGIRAITSTEFICLEAIGEAGAEELWAACMSQRFFEQLRVQATGTTGSHQRVRPEDVLSILVGDPRQLDDRIRTALRDAVRLAHALRLESARVADLRDTLLPKLISGELRVRDAEAELEMAP